MTLVVKRTDGQTVEYKNADRSRVIVEWVENCQRKTAIYETCDFVVVSVKDKEPEETA
ncbi:MAG: hypothetical protein LBC77_09425 [Spirochaetaceae bacterium]|nr:hypothetical protein [Spirochaetaceae bacterium]